jgi:hypothetical protein
MCYQTHSVDSAGEGAPGVMEQPDESKLAVVRDYLRQAFPEHDQLDHLSLRRRGVLFQLLLRGRLVHRLVVPETFLAEHPAPEIARLLETHHVATVLGQAAWRIVVIATDGARIQDDPM